MADVEFTLQGNALYYLVDLGLKPPPSIVEAIDNGQVESVERHPLRVTPQNGVRPQDGFIHGKTQPEMVRNTNEDFTFKMTSAIPVPENDAYFIQTRTYTGADTAHATAVSNGTYPQWKNADEATKFISNLIDKEPLMLMGTNKGKEFENTLVPQLAEEMVKKYAPQKQMVSYLDPDRLGKLDRLNAQEYAETEARLKQEFQKNIPELKQEVLAQVRSNYANNPKLHTQAKDVWPVEPVPPAAPTPPAVAPKAAAPAVPTEAENRKSADDHKALLDKINLDPKFSDAVAAVMEKGNYSTKVMLDSLDREKSLETARLNKDEATAQRVITENKTTFAHLLTVEVVRENALGNITPEALKAAVAALTEKAGPEFNADKAEKILKDLKTGQQELSDVKTRAAGSQLIQAGSKELESAIGKTVDAYIDASPKPLPTPVIKHNDNEKPVPGRP